MGFLGGVFKKKDLEIGSPCSGVCVSIKDVSDPTFSEEILGKGTINTLFPTKHAIGITSTEGVEVLIHVGLDTVNLKGEHFTTHTEAGATVSKGDLLLEADLDAIAAAGYDTITPLLICNSGNYADVVPSVEGKVSQGDCILRIKI